MDVGLNLTFLQSLLFKKLCQKKINVIKKPIDVSLSSESKIEDQD